MQVTTVSRFMPKAIKMLPIAAMMALSSVTLSAKSQQNNNDANHVIERAASDSITAVAKGSIAASRDTIKLENAMRDSLLINAQQVDSTLLAGKNADDIYLGFNIEGTGAEEIHSKVTSSISLSSAGTPYSGQYQALLKQKEILEAKGIDTSDIESQLNNLEDMMQDYIRDNNAIIREKTDENDGNTTDFYYGPNKSKKGTITQYVGLKGNNGIKDRDTRTETQPSDSTGTNNNANRQFNGGVEYGLTLKTENSDVRFLGDFSSENIDIALAGETKKKLDNGVLSSSLSLRETIEPDHHEGSGGASLDYKSDNNNFTTGLLGYYEYSKDKGVEASWQAAASAYFKYKNNIKFEVGDEHIPMADYVYSKLYLTGKKNIPNKDLKLNGRFMAEYGGIIFDKSLDLRPVHNIEVNARGNMMFNPTNDILATLGLGVNYGLQIDEDATDPSDKYYHDFAANILGSFRKDKVEISAMLSFLYNSLNAAMKEVTGKDPLKIASTVTLGIPDLFEGISPFVSYTLNTGVEGLEHNVGGGVKLNIESLSRKK